MAARGCSVITYVGTRRAKFATSAAFSGWRVFRLATLPAHPRSPFCAPCAHSNPSVHRLHEVLGTPQPACFVAPSKATSLCGGRAVESLAGGATAQFFVANHIRVIPVRSRLSEAKSEHFHQAAVHTSADMTRQGRRPRSEASLAPEKLAVQHRRTAENG